MDIQAYISSGILEAYLLGDLPEQEAAEVEKLAEEYPEIRAELHRIEKALERYAQMLGTPPPPGTLTEVLEKLPARTSSAVQPKGPSRARYGLLTWGSLAVALLGILAALWFYRQVKDLQSELSETQSELQILQEDCDEIRSQNERLSRNIDLLVSDATVPVKMEGTELAPGAVATVYFNPANQAAFLNAGSLPQPPSGKTYQLWALIDGNPVDMGIFDLNTSDEEDLVEVPFIEGAQAFAVTLEDAGGNPTPTLSQMYVIGNVG